MLRAAVAPVLLARGLTRAAIRRVACAPEASVLASCFLLLLRDIATSAGVFRWSPLPLAGNVNHRDREFRRPERAVHSRQQRRHLQQL
jgi:hypothetical protein